ncbi:MAG: DegV family protein [Anaerolineae bacterium]|nr:DegV family protein [Anaerolineae bacterium]
MKGKLMSIKIVTDSTCDLPPSLIQQYDITVVPLYINFADKSYRDGVDLSRQQFYEKLPESPVQPTTSVPGIGAFMEAYQALIANGADQIVSIHIAAKLSNTVNIARLAAEAMDDVAITVIDSHQLTVGTGLQVLEAARLADEGKTVSDIVAAIQDTRPRLYTFAALDTLTYLRRSGRLSNFQAILGSLLDLKPLLSMNHNEINMDKVRTQKRAMDWLVKFFVGLGALEQVVLIHTNAPARLQTLWQRVEHLVPHIPSPIAVDVTPVLGAHLGPGVVGFTCLTDKEA